MAIEKPLKRHHAFFEKSPKKTKVPLSPQNEEARELFLNVRSKYSEALFAGELSFDQCNIFLDDFDKSYKLSSNDQSFHFWAREKYLHIIFNTKDASKLPPKHQLSKQQLLEAFLELQHCQVFENPRDAARQHINRSIQRLKKELDEHDSKRGYGCRPSQ